MESLGLETPKLNELNDSYEVENLLENLKQMLFQDYKSMHVFRDWYYASNTQLTFSGPNTNLKDVKLIQAVNVR